MKEYLAWKPGFGATIQVGKPIADTIVFDAPREKLWLPAGTPPAYRTDPVVSEYIGYLREQADYWRARAERAESGLAAQRWPEWRP